MALPCIYSEILVENRHLFMPRYRGPVGLLPSCLVWKKRVVGQFDSEKTEDMYIDLDRITECDRQTDGQTSCHSIVRAMHTRRALKIVQYITKIILVHFFNHSVVQYGRSRPFKSSK